mgnify:CR=1 FL=1
MAKKFAYSFDNIVYHGEFYSVEDTLKEASFDGWDKECPDIWVGECYQDYEPTVYACRVLDDLQEHAYENGGEWAEDWLLGVTDEEERDLQDSLNNVIRAWIKKYKYEPTWFRVCNQEQYNYFEWKERLEN